MFLIKKRSADVQYLISNFMIRSTEADVCRCSSKKVLLKISRCSQESTCVGISLWYNCSPPVLRLYQKVTPARVFLWTLPHCLLLKFNESAFWSWNIIILNLLWRMYFMCILLSDCTNTIVIRLKNRRNYINQFAHMVLRII